MKPISSLPSLVLLLCALTLPAAAGGSDDHERARRALQAGEILPLTEVLATLEHSHPGQILEVELENERGIWIYEIKLLQEGGRVHKLEVDARSGELLRSRSRHKREEVR